MSLSDEARKLGYEELDMQDFINNNVQKVVVNMGEGNPGAMQAIMQVVEFKPIYLLGMLHSIGITGNGVYGVWADICDKQIMKMFYLCYLVEAEVISKEEVISAAKGENRSLAQALAKRVFTIMDADSKSS